MRSEGPRRIAISSFLVLLKLKLLSQRSAASDSRRLELLCRRNSPGNLHQPRIVFRGQNQNAVFIGDHSVAIADTVPTDPRGAKGIHRAGIQPGRPGGTGAQAENRQADPSELGAVPVTPPNDNACAARIECFGHYQVADAPLIVSAIIVDDQNLSFC